MVGGPEEGALDPVCAGGGLRWALIVRAALGYSPDVCVYVCVCACVYLCARLSV